MKIENLNLFECFCVWLSRTCREYKISSDPMFDHRIYVKGKFTFMELTDNVVMIMSDNFNYKATDIVELIKFAAAIA